MAKDKKESVKPADAEKTPEKKKLKEVTVQIGDNEPITGLCTAKRKIPGGGSQVFLKIKGEVGRWFNADDVVKK
jgi:tRNA-binding EMAP/Myf-like protein